MGKNAPESSHMGSRKTLMMAWKPCVESIRQAITKPRAVRATAMTNIRMSAANKPSGVGEMMSSQPIMLGQPAEHEEHDALQHGDGRAAEHLAEHHRPARNRRHEHALQKSFAAVFDDRDRGEDRREQQDHHQRAGKEMGVVEIASCCRPAPNSSQKIIGWPSAPNTRFL